MAKIVSDPMILGGKPVIYGTRISVELIMNFLSAGMSIKDILKEYTELKKPEVLAAIDYAKKLVIQKPDWKLFPEYKSRPLKPHPLFLAFAFIEAVNR